MSDQQALFAPRRTAVQVTTHSLGDGSYGLSVRVHVEGQGWTVQEQYVGLGAAELLDVIDATVFPSLRNLGQL